MSRQMEPGVRLENLRIERVLRSDYYGVTYLARDEELDVWRAVKEYLPEEWGERFSDGIVGPWTAGVREYYQRSLIRFMNGAHILGRLRHPHVVRVHQVYRARGTAYMVMEYVEGRTLAATLEETGPLSEALVRKILAALVDGLSEVHAAGLLHGDINPANVVIRPDGAPVLIDFDFATGRTCEGDGDRLLPSSPYWPPGGPWRESSTDIYALGAVAYEALGGRLPDYSHKLDWLPSVADEAAQPVSAALAAALDAALAPHKEDRPRLDEWRAMVGVESAGRQEVRWQAGGGARFTEVEIVNRGPLFDVFRARLEGRLVYVKCVADRDDRVRRVGLGSVLWQEGNPTNWFVCSGMGWANWDVARPGRAHYEAALRAEHEVIRGAGKHWNHPGATLVRGCGKLAASGAETCLVMPECQGTPLERFSRQEQRQWIPRMLPALWRALAHCPHGDLSPGDLLMDPSGGFFRILDPGVRIDGPRFVGDHGFKLFSTLFTTNIAHYPLLLPEHGPARPRLCAPYGGLTTQLDSWTRQLSGWIDSMPSRKSVRIEQSGDGASPAASDLIALGAMYAFTLTATPLHELLELDVPLWSSRGWEIYDGARYLRREPPAPERCIEVIESGELLQDLQFCGATRPEAELCVGLIALRIDSLEELAAYCGRV